MSLIAGFGAKAQTLRRHHLWQLASSPSQTSEEGARSAPAPDASLGDQGSGPSRRKRAAGADTSIVRAMGSNEIVRSAFGLYREYFGKVLGLALPLMLLLVLRVVLQLQVISLLSQVATGSTLGTIAVTSGVSLLVAFLISSCVFLSAAAATLAVSQAALHQPVQVLDAYRRVFSVPLLGRVIAGSAVVALAGFSIGLEPIRITSLGKAGATISWGR